MSFVDELRRSAPTKDELRAKEKQKKCEKQNRIDVLLQKECESIILRVKRQSKLVNEKGERKYIGDYGVDYGSILPGHGTIKSELNEKEKKEYAKRLRDLVSEGLKKEGFKESVKLGKHLDVWWELRIKVLW